MEVGNLHRTAALLAAVAGMLLGPASAVADSGATTLPATNLTFTSAQLNGSVNQAPSGSDYFFQYGTSSAYGSSTSPAPTSGSQQVSAPVSNLQPGVTYHFRLVVEEPYPNSAQFGSDLSFTTPVPSSVATTSNATSITNSSARLNGVVNTSNPDSQWSFQYGTTTSYGNVTRPQPIGATVAAVSATVGGLRAGTTYHFRLLVEQGSYPTTSSTGADRTFKTSNFGSISLRRRKLRVSHHKVTIRLRCKGASAAICRGTLRITVRAADGTRLPCAGGHFTLHAGKRKKLEKTVRGGCLKLLAGKHKHRLRASLDATLAGPQGQFHRSVKLFE